MLVLLFSRICYSFVVQSYCCRPAEVDIYPYIFLVCITETTFQATIRLDSCFAFDEKLTIYNATEFVKRLSTLEATNHIFIEIVIHLTIIKKIIINNKFS